MGEHRAHWLLETRYSASADEQEKIWLSLDKPVTP